jgi:oxygen-independent coproporphyrinogen-3 oxidase
MSVGNGHNRLSFFPELSQNIVSLLKNGPWGVYIHLPWCRYRCPYCAFVVDARPNPPHERYQQLLLQEWENQRSAFPESPPETLYFGGGTPSRSPLSTFAALIERIRPATEISAEVNPEDCTPALLSGLAEIGINRLSIGVQSFQEPVARRLGRTRAARAAIQAVEAARLLFPSLSIDLIFGGPASSWQTLEQDIQQAISLGVDHLSLYGLTLEEGTAFFRSKPTMADEDSWRQQYDQAVQLLLEHGLFRYEVSNFAKTGYESRHNGLYWEPWSWLGLGTGAHSFFPTGDRSANPSVEDYLAEKASKQEVADPRLLAWDLLWSGLRQRAGLNPERYRMLTGCSLDCPPELLRYGLLRWHQGRLQLTAAGYPLADAVAEKLYRAGCIHPRY